MFGGPGDDVNLWAPGDGSEAFIGGPGLDALIFGATDREALADPSDGCSAADPAVRYSWVSSGHTDSGREWSAQISARWSPAPRRVTNIWCGSAAPAGNIIVTVRVSEVEQVFCRSRRRSIAFADLTDPSPAFVAVSQQEVATLNSLVAGMIR